MPIERDAEPDPGRLEVSRRVETAFRLRSRRRQHFTNPHALQPLPERVTIDAVAIAKEVGRREVVWEGVDDPLGGPGAMGTQLPLDQDVAMVRTRPRLTGFND